MGDGFSPWSFNCFFIFLLAFKFVDHGSFARELIVIPIHDTPKVEAAYHGDQMRHKAVSFHRQMHYHDHRSSSSSSHVDDPSFKIFFHIEDLKMGTKLPLYFSIQTLQSTPKIIPKQLANSIPFSTSQLPYLLHFFSFPNSSPQAKAMEQTLKHCELPPIRGETKFCATSLESMLDYTRQVFSHQDPSSIKVLTTRFLTNLTVSLQNYTIAEEPKEILISKMIGCHPLPYPYKVFYCHGQKGDNRVFRISLKGENGIMIEAVGICHMDTSQWDDNHVAFSVLGVQPGRAPVCHVFPPDNLVWIAGSSPTSFV